MTFLPFDRYKSPISSIFSEESHLQLQLEVEATLVWAWAQLGRIPKEAASEIARACSSGNITVERVHELEKQTHHDVMAMVLAISELCPKYGGYVHLGATSYDIQDTVLGLQLKKAKQVILNHARMVLNLLIRFAEKYKDFPAIGRTHGQHAIPITLGFKFANYASELYWIIRQIEETTVEYGKMAGAVGTYASFGTRDVEKLVLNQLNLRKLPITTQVVPRVIHATFLSQVAAMIGVIERLAKEIRHLQRTEIGEIFESFERGQVGSSTMPQKRNPHKSKRSNGIARVITANVQVALENIALEHERDLTNSSSERVIIPETLILADYLLLQAKQILENLEVNEARIKKNLHLLNGRQCAERLMIRLSDAIGRQRAHELLKDLSASSDFKKAVMNHPEIKEHLTTSEIEDLLNPESYLGLAPEVTEAVISEISHYLEEHFTTPENSIVLTNGGSREKTVLPSIPKTYAEAGVDISKEHQTVQVLQEWVQKSFAFGNVISKFGHYANLIEYDGLLLALTTDGVGSKVLIAQMAKKFDTVGIDCVAMNVNDLLAMNIRPLAFVDYLAVQNPLSPEIAEQIAKGIYLGCQEAKIPILGGELATLPEIINGVNGLGFDLAGTALGVVTPEQLVTGKNIKPGDKIIGLASSGLHSNGYTLARKILLSELSLDDNFSWGVRVADELLRPTRIYVRSVLELTSKIPVTGLAHITGSGFKKLHRITQYGFKLSEFPDIPPIFMEIQERGSVTHEEMFSTFNMGIGFVITVRGEHVDAALKILQNHGEKAYVLGEITESGKIEITQYDVTL